MAWQERKAGQVTSICVTDATHCLEQDRQGTLCCSGGTSQGPLAAAQSWHASPGRRLQRFSAHTHLRVISLETFPFPYLEQPAEWWQEGTSTWNCSRLSRTNLQLGREGLAWYPQNPVFPDIFYRFGPLLLWVVNCSGQAQSYYVSNYVIICIYYYYVYKVSSMGSYLEPQTTSNSFGISALASLPKAFHVNSNSSEKKCCVSGEPTFD